MASVTPSSMSTPRCPTRGFAAGGVVFCRRTRLSSSCSRPLVPWVAFSRPGGTPPGAKRWT
eukprot:7160431-Lingulodinium_polyedra.AAC.1